MPFNGIFASSSRPCRVIAQLNTTTVRGDAYREYNRTFNMQHQSTPTNDMNGQPLCTKSDMRDERKGCLKKQMKWKVVKFIAVTALIFSMISVCLGAESYLIVDAQDSSFESLNQGDYVRIYDIHGNPHLWRVVDATKRRVVYAEADQATGVQSWGEAKASGDSFKLQFSTSLVDYIGPGLLTYEDYLSVTEDTYGTSNQLIHIGVDYWTYSDEFASDGHAWAVVDNGTSSIITEENPQTSFAVRPALTLQTGLVTASGKGTESKPYTLRPESTDNGPSTPNIIAPDENEWFHSFPEIHFTVEHPNKDRLTEFEIEISKTDDFSSMYSEHITGNWSSGSMISHAPEHTLEDGIQYVRVRARDQWGSWGDWSDAHTVRIDTQQPGTPHLSGVTDGWTNEEVIVTIEHGEPANNGEELSPISHSEYRIRTPEQSLGEDEGWELVPDDGKVTLTETGQFYIDARTFNVVGNSSEVISALVQIDRVSPTAPQYTLEPDDEWTNADEVTLTLEPGTDEESGVDRVEYRSRTSADTPWEDLGWNKYSQSLTLEWEGITEIQVRTVDKADNSSEPVTIEVKIDRTAPDQPVITVEGDMDWSDPQVWSDQAVSFTLEHGEDERSGIAFSEYRFDQDEEWIRYTGDSVTTGDREGEITIYSRTLDHAGNASEETSITVRVDMTPPTKPTSVTTNPPLEGWTSKPIYFEIEGAEDQHSGVAAYVYKLRENDQYLSDDFLLYEPDVGFEVVGEYELHFWAVDFAGNRSEDYASVTVRFDNTQPQAPHVQFFNEGQELGDGAWATPTDRCEVGSRSRSSKWC